MTWENRIILEASSADPDSDTPVWVDLSSRIRDAVQPVSLGTGRQNDLDTAEPAVLQVLLDSSDDALTYGNTTGPYPWWGPGRRIRWREVIGGVSVPQFDGFITQINETVTTRGIEQRVMVTATDRLGRLQSAEPFLSTLAAYIRYNGGTALKFYAPLIGPPWSDVIGGQLPLPFFNSSGSFGVTTSVTVTDSGTGLALADDAPGSALFAPGISGGLVDWFAYQLTSGIPMVAGQVMTLAGWVSFTSGGTICIPLSVSMFEVPPGSSNVELSIDNATGQWQGKVHNGTLTGSFLTGQVAVPGNIQPVAIRYGFSPPVFEVWIGANQYVGALAGVAPTSASIISLSAAFFGFVGTIAHAQLYVGDPSEFAFANFQAQLQLGLLGLDRQSTGDRIRTIAQYAGVPASQMTQIDTGTSVMQRARLAGQTPLDAMRDAERTEQGLLYCDGNGNLVFKDRRTLYNI